MRSGKAGTTIDVVYLSGGGAELVLREVVSAYTQTQLVKNAQLANAQGYLNYARFAERESCVGFTRLTSGLTAVKPETEGV